MRHLSATLLVLLFHPALLAGCAASIQIPRHAPEAEQSRTPAHESAEVYFETGEPAVLTLVTHEPVVEMGRVQVSSPALGARMLVAGQDVESLPAELELPLGSHQAMVTCPGVVGAVTQEVVVRSGEVTTLVLCAPEPGDSTPVAP